MHDVAILSYLIEARYEPCDLNESNGQFIGPHILVTPDPSPPDPSPP
jgi:hypothetical protein